MNFNNKRVLIVPLDWGLGHATRCIPIVRAFLLKGWTVILGAEDAQARLLQAEFPQLTILPVKGYRMRYSRQRWSLPLSILAQVPKILRSIRAEHRWLQAVVREHQVDLVISDNRYGMYTKQVPAVFITHQLQIKAPFRWMERWIKRMNFNYISRFDECWVPDVVGHGLAGDLSHLAELHPFPIRYLGTLSRFQKKLAAVKYKYLFLVSGPEPQRSLLEQLILSQAPGLQQDSLIVLGKPGDTQVRQLSRHVAVVDHLHGDALEQAMNSTEYIVSRAGYTTIMEAAALQKRLVLIPTPGQTEQEYLGCHLMEQQYALTLQQQDFSIAAMETALRTFSYRSYPVLIDHLPTTIEIFLRQQMMYRASNSFASHD